MKPLSERDYQLSMRTSPRSPHAENNQGLRDLLVHRLRDADKAVVRLPRQKSGTAPGHFRVHCEPCGQWFALAAWGEEFQCPHCDQLYALEYAVFSAVPRP